MPPLDTRIPDENQRRMQSGLKPMEEAEAQLWLADLDSAQAAADEPSENPDRATDDEFEEGVIEAETPATEPGDEDSATTETEQ